MRAIDVMTHEVFTCTPDETLADAARIMFEEDVGSVPVVDPQGAVVGVLTDRDVCRCAYEEDKRLSDVSVKGAMSRNVISVRPDDDLERVEELMEVNRIRRVPVIDDDGLLSGIIAVADLARSSGDGVEEVSEHELAEVVGAVSLPHAVHARSS